MTFPELRWNEAQSKFAVNSFFGGSGHFLKASRASFKPPNMFGGPSGLYKRQSPVCFVRRVNIQERAGRKFQKSVVGARLQNVRFAAVTLKFGQNGCEVGSLDHEGHFIEHFDFASIGACRLRARDLAFVDEE